MPRIFQKLLGGLWWVLNFRPLRLFAVLAFILWGFDCAVTFWTDAVWFASLGLSSTFWHSRLLQIGLFGAFFVLSLLAAIPFMRVIANPVNERHSAVSFPRALDFLGHWHALAPKLSWLVVLITAFLCAHSFGDNWMLFEAFRYAPNVWGTNEKFWFGTLPFLSLLLGLVWKFVLVLLFVVALGGGVRSLPFMATRNPIQPLKWIRSLIILGVIAIALRAIGYLDQIASLARGSEMTGFETYVKTPVYIFGIALCIAAAVGVLRGAKRRTLLFLISAVLVLPAVLNIGLAPFLFWLPSPFSDGITKKLAFQSPPLALEKGPKLSFEESWPLWSEPQLLDAARIRYPKKLDQQVLNWQKAALFQDEEKKWHAGIVGEAIPVNSYQSDIVANADSAQQWMTLDLSRLSGGIPVKETRLEPPVPAFYGVSGPVLFSNESKLGVGIQGLNGLFWSWRLRSPFLMLQGAGKKQFLPFRGTQEAAQKIAPMFLWSEARPVRDKNQWYWVCDGYGVSSNFPNVEAVDNGLLAGKNFARLSVRAIQNPASGEISFAPPVDDLNTTDYKDPLFRLWKLAFPKLLSDAPRPLDLKMNEDEIGDIDNSETLIWTNDARLTTPEKLDSGSQRFKIESALNAINTAKQPETDDEKLERGTPCVWQDGKDWWIGVAYFAVKSSLNVEQTRSIRLHHVVFGKLGEEILGKGASISAAKAAYILKSRIKEAEKKSNGKNKNSVPLEIQAFQAHERAEKALRERDVVTSGRERELEKKLLEEMIRRKKEQ